MFRRVHDDSPTTLVYGTVVVLLSWALAWIALEFGSYGELLALVTGFIFVAPVSTSVDCPHCGTGQAW